VTLGEVEEAVHVLQDAGATQLTLTAGAKAFAMACVSMCSAAFELQ